MPPKRRMLPFGIGKRAERKKPEHPKVPTIPSEFLEDGARILVQFNKKQIRVKLGNQRIFLPAYIEGDEIHNNLMKQIKVQQKENDVPTKILATKLLLNHHFRKQGGVAKQVRALPKIKIDPVPEELIHDDASIFVNIRLKSIQFKLGDIKYVLPHELKGDETHNRLVYHIDMYDDMGDYTAKIVAAKELLRHHLKRQQDSGV